MGACRFWGGSRCVHRPPRGPRSARDAPPAPPGQEVEHLLVVISDLGVDRPRPGRRRLVGGRRCLREERRNDPVGRPKAPNRGVMSWSRQYRTRTRHPCRVEPVPTLQRSVSTGIRPGQRVSFRVLHDGVVSLFSIRRMPRVKGRKRSSRGFAVRPAGEAPVPGRLYAGDSRRAEGPVEGIHRTRLESLCGMSDRVSERNPRLNSDRNVRTHSPVNTCSSSRTEVLGAALVQGAGGFLGRMRRDADGHLCLGEGRSFGCGRQWALNHDGFVSARGDSGVFVAISSARMILKCQETAFPSTVKGRVQDLLKSARICNNVASVDSST